MMVVPQTVQRDMTKDIVSGIAITTFIVAVSMYIPILGFFCALFIPLPILFYRSKLGRTTGVIIPVFTVIAMVIMFGRITIDILIFVELLFIGFMLSEFIELNLSIEKTVLYTCGTVFMSGLLGLIFYSHFFSTGIYTLVSEYVAKNLEITISLYKNMGMPEENIHMISNSLDHIQYVLVRIIPALFIASTVFVTWASLLLAKPIFRAKALFYPAFGQLNLWKAPEPLVWGVIGCGLLLIFPVSALKMIGLNGMLVFLTIYFFQGIAIVSFYFEKKRFPRILRFFLYSLIALQQVLLFLIVGLGFFDMWLNLRKLEADRDETR
jgi:uncharacterized protein YybS (DUF2232 family)